MWAFAVSGREGGLLPSFGGGARLRVDYMVGGLMMLVEARNLQRDASTKLSRIF